MWDSIKKNYNQYNGVMLSKLKCAIDNVRQGDMTLTEYYSKVQKLMSELDIIEPVIICNCCTCEFKGESLGRINRDRMIQFVNGLNDKYEVVRNQLLLIDSMSSNE